MDDKWYITQQTFPALMHRNATQFGDRRAQWWKTGPAETTSLTYAELGHIVDELACGLMELGLQKGDRAAVTAHTCPQWVWADYSILCAGGITVCVYPTLSAGELAFIVNDSGSRILYVADAEMLDKARGAWADMPSLERIIVLQDRVDCDDPKVLGLAQVREMGCALLARDAGEYETRWRSVELHDRMTIVYTSGTTGRQKGAVHTHFSINAACARDCIAIPPYRPDDVLMSFLPLAHTYERQCGHGTAMHAAVTIAYSSPQTLLQDLQVFRPTVFMSVPRIYERIYMAMREMASQSPVKKAVFEFAMRTGLQLTEARADKDGFIDMSEGIDFTRGVGPGLVLKYKLVDHLVFRKVRSLLGGRFRFAFSAAGGLSADLCKVFMAMGVRIIEGYGATETSNTVNLNRLDRILPGSVGPLCPNVEGRMADDGEWLVKGPNVITEYWNNPDATREAFTDDGFYRTGDIVKMCADGYIRIVDRKKGIMVLDTGKNIPAAKLENLFSVCRWIDIVVPVADDRPFVTALVVPKYDAFVRLFDAEAIPYDRDALRFMGEGAARMCVQVGDDFVAQPRLKSLVDGEMHDANGRLEEYEQIRKYAIVPRRFSEAQGEMTPTLKIKRNVVLKNFATEIDAMYPKSVV